MTQTVQRNDLQSQAGEWVSVLHSGDVSDAQKETWEKWMAADERHRTAYENALSMWRAIEGMDDLRGLLREDEATTAQEAGAHVRTRWRLGVAATLAAAATLMFVVFTGDNNRPPTAAAPVGEQVVTAVAELRNLTLPDGSEVTLGAKSQVDVNFSAAERRVTLKDGVAFFAVQKDASRPFFVTVGDAVIKVVGTRFDVRKGVSGVSVTVVEGVVEVATPAQDIRSPETETRRLVTAGQKLETRASTSVASAAIKPVAESESAPWREGRLVYRDTALREVVADVNRYFSGELRLSDEELGAVGVTAAFSANEVEQLIDGLAAVLELDVVHLENGDVVLSRKNG
jgi:transmembrane sensor